MSDETTYELLSDERIEDLLRWFGDVPNGLIYRLAEEVQAHRAARRIEPEVMATVRAEMFDQHVDQALEVVQEYALCGAPDCAERTDCFVVGGAGHLQCGWCEKHDQPRHHCVMAGCLQFVSVRS